jgi:hypothetical protein
MARIAGLLLMLVAIYYGAKIYMGELDRASSDVAVQEASANAESELDPGERPPGGGRAAPSAVTSRVRERVTDAITEGARRHTGEGE